MSRVVLAAETRHFLAEVNVTVIWTTFSRAASKVNNPGIACGKRIRRCLAAVTARISLAVWGLCAFTVLVSAQDLAIKSSHTSSFQLRQTNAYNLFRVTSVDSAPTAGSVAITENAIAGLAVISLYGQDWTCTVNSCSRCNALAASASYPAIMVVVVGVAPSVRSTLTNQATVSGGGDSNAASNTALDVTTVAANGYLVACGSNASWKMEMPPGTEKVVAAATGLYAAVAVRSDGTIVSSSYLTSGLAAVPRLTESRMIGCSELRSCAAPRRPQATRQVIPAAMQGHVGI